MKNLLTPVLILLSIAIIAGAITYANRTSTETVAEESVAKEPKLEHVHGFSVDVSNENRLLIATHHGLMQFLDNKLSKIGAVSDDLMGFTPHPTDPSVYFSSGHPTRGGSLGFQKSSDGGTTWQKVSDGINGPVDFHSMAISTVDPDLIYGHFGSLQHSKDGGKTWQVAKGSVQPYSLSTDPKREGIIYAASANGVLMSEDNGDSWKSYSSGLDNGAVSTFAVSPDASYALAFSQVLGGLGKTTNNGITWSKISESFGGSAILFISYSKTNPLIAYSMTQANDIFKSSDGGATWIKLK